jgi:hypothetical protein
LPSWPWMPPGGEGSSGSGTGQPVTGAGSSRITCARIAAAGCCPARDQTIRYNRRLPLHQPTAPGQRWVMRRPGPEGPGQAPGHTPAPEAGARIRHAALPGQFVAGGGAQVENQVLPDRLHLVNAAAVMAQVGDVCHWAPRERNGPRLQGGRTKRLRTVSAAAMWSLLQLPGSGATPRHYAAADDRARRYRSSA